MILAADCSAAWYAVWLWFSRTIVVGKNPAKRGKSKRFRVGSGG